MHAPTYPVSCTKALRAQKPQPRGKECIIQQMDTGQAIGQPASNNLPCCPFVNRNPFPDWLQRRKIVSMYMHIVGLSLLG